RHREERFEKSVAVPVQHADRIARPDAHSCKRGSQPADPLPELAVSEAPQVTIDDLLIGSLEQRRMPQMLDDERIMIGRLCGGDATSHPLRCRKLFWQRRPGYRVISHLGSHSSSLPAFAAS